MANEITLSIALSFLKGGRKAEMLSLGQLLTMTGTDYVLGTQTIGTSAEAIAKNDIGTCGLIGIKNLDATNYVTIRDGSGGADVVKVKPGEVQVFRLATNSPYAIANSAPVEIEYLLIED